MCAAIRTPARIDRAGAHRIKGFIGVAPAANGGRAAEGIAETGRKKALALSLNTNSHNCRLC
jgi:hypothetical protein